ncbi:cupin domain-containing protein [bacterium]|nr:cupin domain-containing protein [bacterium]
MKILEYSKIDSKVFVGDAVRGITGRIAIGKQDGAENFCMRVFEVEKGGYTPKHSHDWEHEIFFHAGKGEVLFDGKWVAVNAGFVAFIPGGMEHQIKNQGDSKLVFVCLIPAGAPEI